MVEVQCSGHSVEAVHLDRVCLVLLLEAVRWVVMPPSPRVVSDGLTLEVGIQRHMSLIMRWYQALWRNVDSPVHI